MDRNEGRGGLTHSDVLGARVSEPLVHLVHDADDVVPLAQLGHHLQLLSCKHLHTQTKWPPTGDKGFSIKSHLSQRIVGVVDNEHLCLGREGSL